MNIYREGEELAAQEQNEPAGCVGERGFYESVYVDLWYLDNCLRRAINPNTETDRDEALLKARELTQLLHRAIWEHAAARGVELDKEL